MVRIFLRRQPFTLVVVFCVMSIAFLLSYAVPSDPARVAVGPRASADTVARARRQMGLDQPLYVQYGRFMARVLRADFGFSYVYNRPVLPEIVRRLPATVRLALGGVLVEVLLGIPIGVISAIRAHSLLDRILMVNAFVLLAAPMFWLGLLLLYLFGFRLSLFPLGGYGGVHHLVLPALTLGSGGIPWMARMTRSTMLDVMNSDYIRTARAKGLRESVVVVRHGLRNALIPIVTMFGMDLGAFLGGAVVVEAVFAWPGVGLLAWDAVRQMDIPMLMGTVMFAAFFIVLANLLVDTVYSLLDPRVRAI